MEKLRGYDCYFVFDHSQNPDINRKACWAGVRAKEKGTIIKIGNFNKYFEEKYVEKLIELINQITPCYIESDKNNKKYIYYSIIGGYTKDLYILNFIRYLWYSDNEFDNLNFLKTLSGENELTSKFIDPLEILSFSAMTSMKPGNYYSGDHSGLYASGGGYMNKSSKNINETKVRSLEEFNAWDGMTPMSAFSKGIENN